MNYREGASFVHSSSGIWDRDTAGGNCRKGSALSSSSSDGRVSLGRDTREFTPSSSFVGVESFRRPTTSLSLGHGGEEGGDMEGEGGDSFLQEAVKLKSGSSSVGNFVRKLVQVIFQPGELQNHHSTGTREKEY